MDRKRVVFAVIALLSLSAVACGDDDDDDPGPSPSLTVASPTRSATATPSPDEPTLTPTPGPTGNTALDTTIEAVTSGDVAAIVDRFEYLSLECVATPEVGGPPACDPGEPPGTLVEVFPLVGCEGEYMRPAKSEGVLDRWLDGTTAEVYAVASLEAAGQPDAFPAGEYVVVVALEREDSGPEAFGFGMDADGNIVSAGPRCRATAADILEQSPVDTVLVSPPGGG